jgi:hypothetical protein
MCVRPRADRIGGQSPHRTTPAPKQRGPALRRAKTTFMPFLRLVRSMAEIELGHVAAGGNSAVVGIGCGGGGCRRRSRACGSLRQCRYRRRLAAAAARARARP